MKLSDYQLQIKQAYQAILHDIHLQNNRPEYAFNFIRWWLRHVLPREQSHSDIPLPAVEYSPEQQLTAFQAKEKLVQVVTFQATFQDSVTPMTTGIVPLILDTGASISITPFKSDFITPIRPVQHVNRA